MKEALSRHLYTLSQDLKPTKYEENDAKKGFSIDEEGYKAY